MIGISKVSPSCAALFLLLSLMVAPPAAAQPMAEGECRQWVVPAQLVVKRLLKSFASFAFRPERFVILQDSRAFRSRNQCETAVPAIQYLKLLHSC